jgi:hypothetical protein
MNRTSFAHRFVEAVPDHIEEGIIYISMENGAAIHCCPCGCKREVVTPFSPTDWKLVFDGEAISLFPSIGNWSYPCRSHYWIEENQVIWARSMTPAQIAAGRAFDQRAKVHYYSDLQVSKEASNPSVQRQNPESPNANGLWDAIRRWWS